MSTTKRPVCARKTAFRNEEMAKHALTRIRVHGDEREKTPVRSYECPFCAKWHLTSMDTPTA